MPMVGVPKTIDNDLQVTDFTFGFDTAINIVTEAVDRLRTTAESHRRTIVVETMGRHAGWIACFSGIATAADYILVPELPIDIDHVAEVLKRQRAAGKNYNIVVVSEGAQFPDKGHSTIAAETDAFGHVRLGGVGNAVAELIEQKTGFETRCVVLGHIQRGGSPTANDRILATRLGLGAAKLVIKQEVRHHGGPVGDQDHRDHPRRRRGFVEDSRPRLLPGSLDVLSLKQKSEAGR